MRSSLAVLTFLALLAAACGGDQPTDNNGGNTNTASSQPPAHTPDDWHTCDSLFAMMGGVKGKVVADLFVGDGYYTMKLLEAGARVIAMDDDPRNVEAITAKKNEMGIGDDRLIIRSSTAGAPNLSLNEV